jgi:SAM-dependent methyltransferase
MSQADAGRAGGAMTPIGALLSEGSIVYSVRTGRPAASALLGRPVFEYIAADAAASAVLAAFTARATEKEAPAIVMAADFARFASVLDVGGGTGALIKHVLLGSPGTRGAVFDTAGSAPAATDFLAAVPEIAGRWQVLSGSFFDGVPAGAGAYLLKSVLHDWDDPTSVRILRNIAAVMAPPARLLIIEPVLPEFAGWSAAHLPAVLSDVVCMVMSDGGRERTAAQYRALLAESGFRLLSAAPVAGSAHFHVLEAALDGAH